MYARIKINNCGPFYITAEPNLTILGFAQQLSLYSNNLGVIGLEVLALEINQGEVALDGSEERFKERNRQALKLVEHILNVKKIAGISSP